MRKFLLIVLLIGISLAVVRCAVPRPIEYGSPSTPTPSPTGSHSRAHR